MKKILLALALTAGVFPNVAGTTDVDPEADFRVVTGQPADLDVSYLQVNAFGFGGQDSSLVLRRSADGGATA